MVPFPCYEVTIVKQILKFKSSARSRGLEIATLTTLLYVGWLPQESNITKGNLRWQNRSKLGLLQSPRNQLDPRLDLCCNTAAKVNTAVRVTLLNVKPNPCCNTIVKVNSIARLTLMTRSSKPSELGIC